MSCCTAAKGNMIYITVNGTIVGIMCCFILQFLLELFHVNIQIIAKNICMECLGKTGGPMSSNSNDSISSHINGMECLRFKIQ
jgi:hypothetical protein